MKSKRFIVSSSIVGAFMIGAVAIAAGNFADAEGKWYEDAANWASDTGIIEGIDGQFAGGEDMNRAQGVTMLMRYNEYLMAEMDLMKADMEAMEKKMDEMMNEGEGEEEMEEMMYSAHLTGAQEVPAVDTDAMGMAEVTVKGNMLTYKVTVEGLTGDVTAAHFHSGAMGVNGDAVHALEAFADDMSTGTWEMTEAEMKMLQDGGLYLNVHTAANADGEIRGQVLMPLTLHLENLSEGTLSGGLVVVHTDEASLNFVGDKAPEALEPLAEWGDASELAEMLEGLDGVVAVYDTEAMTAGQKMDMMMKELDGTMHVSVIAMYVGSNDGYALVDSMKLMTGESMVAVNHDAGTEQNEALDGGFENGQPDADKTDQENMDNGTATDEDVAVHDQLTDDLLKAMLK